MHAVLLAKGGGAVELLRKLTEGDPIAFLILGVAIILTALIAWLSFYLLKQKGQRLANGIGDCTYTFAPDGLFGRRFFLISGEWENMPFTLESHKTEKKGDHRTVLRLQKPPEITWAEIQATLIDSRELVQAAQDITESPDAIAFIYVGVGGDPQLLKTLLHEVASAISLSKAEKN